MSDEIDKADAWEAIAAKNAEIKRLEAECFSLAAWACVHFDGKTGLVQDEHGNGYCAKDQVITRLTAEVERLTKARNECERQYQLKVTELGEATAENERLRAALEVLVSNIEHAFPTLKELGPVKNARAALSRDAAKEGGEG